MCVCVCVCVCVDIYAHIIRYSTCRIGSLSTLPAGNKHSPPGGNLEEVDHGHSTLQFHFPSGTIIMKSYLRSDTTVTG